MTNEEYILKNKEADIRSLALKKVPEGVDALWCLRQIEGYQLAKKKLPRWAATEGVWFPPRLSMEQCSSEATANYKSEITQRLIASYNTPSCNLIDLTGGFGVDFSYMAKGFDHPIYIERQAVLCEAARHNFPLLGLHNAEVINANSESITDNKEYNMIFLDPARRDECGNKVFAIEDCTPDIAALQNSLLAKADFVMVKLSPMLDITKALRTLPHTIEVHVVSVKCECKELLFVMSSKHTPERLTYHCVNLDTNDDSFICEAERPSVNIGNTDTAQYLFEPNASILKAGVQDNFADYYHLKKLHPMSNLFVNTATLPNIPARTFRILDIYSFSKQDTKRLQHEVKQANLTIRNFPSTVAELRKRLKIKEGGQTYLFATTLHDGNHVILKCEKA